MDRFVNQKNLTLALAAFGAFHVAGQAARMAHWTFTKVLKAGVNLSKYRISGSQNSWAIVTGASDGIGKAFAIELAREGFSVVVIARTKSKLEEVAKECEEVAAKAKKTINTLVVPFDYSGATVEDYANLRETLTTAHVLSCLSILVNNVGIANDYPDYVENQDPAIDSRIVKVNCESQVQMTKICLPSMKSRNQGAILSLSSFSVQMEAPFLVTYAASKAFNKTFSLALHTELQHTNIDVLAVKPGFVISSMTGLKKTSWPNIVEAKPTARHTLAQLTLASNPIFGIPETSGNFGHSILSAVLGTLPDAIRRRMCFNMMQAAHKKAIRRIKKQQEEEKQKK